MSKRVVIVGGGLAGLAAAEALSARGLSVTLLESRPRLGGRASSFEDKTTGTRIDNCQHVSLGCCTNFRDFCERTGLADSFRVEKELTFIGCDGRANRFAASRLPAPLHLLAAFGRLSYLDRRDRKALAAGLRALAKADTASLDGEPFDAWLARHGQTENAVNRFWHVVLISALSETLDRISTAHARKVFVDAFLANSDGWTVQIPTRPLDELYGSRLTGHLSGQGAAVRTGAGIKRLIGENGRITAAELRSGEVIEGDEFVLAVPHHLVRSLLPESLAGRAALDDLDRLETAPISSVHLWFDRPITNLPHAVLVDRLSQWMFNRTAIQGDGGDGRHYYQVVISASREVDRAPSADTIAAVREEFEELWPETRAAELVHARLVTEHRAVFSVTPGSDRLRPPQQSPIGNLQLAGDWTQTGWPATMEGAVRSGYLAAENVLARLGRPERLVRPDLPAARLSRWLFGLPSRTG
jgi:squalene-associated FAD-dependent desaturase